MESDACVGLSQWSRGYNSSSLVCGTVSGTFAHTILLPARCSTPRAAARGAGQRCTCGYFPRSADISNTNYSAYVPPVLFLSVFTKTTHCRQLQLANFTRYQVKGKPANVFVLLRNTRGAPALPASTPPGARRPHQLNADDLRIRPDFCGSIEGFKDDWDVPHMAKMRVSAAVDLTDCMQRAGLTTAIAPKDPARPKMGPARPAVKLAQLKLYAVAPDGTDLSPLFDFGKQSISWTLPLDVRVNVVDQAMLRDDGPVRDKPTVSTAAEIEYVYTQMAGEFHE